MGVSWNKALELASRITHPYTVAVFAAVLATIALVYALMKRKPRLGFLLALVLLALGLGPLAESTYLASRGIYHIRIVVLASNGRPEEHAKVSSSAGGELKTASVN